MQANFDKNLTEVEAELEAKRAEMQAELDGYKRELGAAAGAAAASAAASAASVAAAAAAPAAASQTEVPSLRDTVQASLEESQAARQESNMLREKVALGEECLEEEFLTELSLREEIARRKQHGEVLLARIQTLQGQTATQVQNIDAGWLPVGQEDRGGAGAPAAATVPTSGSVLSYYPEEPNGDGREQEFEPDIDDIARRNRLFSGQAPRPQPRLRPSPRRLEESPSLEESFRDEAGDVFLRHAGFCGSIEGDDDDQDKEGCLSLPREFPRLRENVGDESSRIEVVARHMAEAWAKLDVDGGDPEARHLERERDHLTREVHELTAQLDASGATGDSSSRLDSDGSDGNLGDRSTATSTSVTADALPTGVSRRRTDPAEQAAAAPAPAPAPVPTAHRRQQGDGDSDSVGVWDVRCRSDNDTRETGPQRSRSHGEIDARSTPGSSSPAMSASGDDLGFIFSDSSSSRSNSSSSSSRPTLSASRSWQSLVPRRQQSLLGLDSSSQPRLLPQGREKQGVSTEEDWRAAGRTRRAIPSLFGWGMAQEISGSEVATDVAGSGADEGWGVQRRDYRQQ
ncbi:unnamed protein product [Pylaiella littoralis]